MARRVIPIRLDLETIVQIDLIADRMSERGGGIHIPRSEVCRTAIARGLAELAAEIGIGSRRPGYRPRRRRKNKRGNG